MAGLDAMKDLATVQNRHTLRTSVNAITQTRSAYEKCTSKLNPVHDSSTSAKAAAQSKPGGDALKPIALTAALVTPKTALATGVSIDLSAPLKTPLPPVQPLHPIQFPTPAPGKSVLKVGLDIDVQRITATIQWDHLNPKPPRDSKTKLYTLWPCSFGPQGGPLPGAAEGSASRGLLVG
jgi:hypothetical protein